MNKLSGYQKLKKENQELRNKLIILVNTPNSAAALEIKTEMTLRQEIENAVWKGCSSNISDGFLKSIFQ